MNDYVGWDWRLEDWRLSDPYGDEPPATEPDEDWADADDDEGMDDCETVAEYRRINRQWTDYLDTQSVQP